MKESRKTMSTSNNKDVQDNIHDEFYAPILRQMEKDWADKDTEGQLIGKYKRLPDGRWFFHGVPGWMKHHESKLMELCYQAGVHENDH